MLIESTGWLELRVKLTKDKPNPQTLNVSKIPSYLCLHALSNARNNRIKHIKKRYFFYKSANISTIIARSTHLLAAGDYLWLSDFPKPMLGSN